MGLKDKFKKRRETHENGYVSFTQDDLKEGMKTNPANQDAYELLDAAMTTSSHITAEDENKQTVNIDDVYPCSEAECDEMDRLLEQAKAKVKDPNDKFFQERYNELQGIVDWSRKKHWTFKWVLIAGCILSIFIMFYISEEVSGDRQSIESKVNAIKNWEKQDTTIVFAECNVDSLTYTIKSHNIYKAFALNSIKNGYERSLEEIENYKHSLDTAKSSERKEYYEKQVKKWEETAAGLLKHYDEVNEMSFKKYRKQAINSYKSELRAARRLDRFIWILFIYVLLLTPFYIYSSHQYGYYITRYRAERAKLDKLQKWGFRVAALFLGAGLAMALLPDTKVTTYYSNGSTSTHTESNPINMMILALKLMLLAAAACIFSFVCIFIMSYVTITSFKRNHDWSAVAQKTKSIAGQATDIAKKAASKAAVIVEEKIQEQKQLKDGSSKDSEV
jgi:hypothetical protein